MTHIRSILQKAQDKHDNYVAVWERTLEDFPSIWQELERLDIEPDFDPRDGCINVRFAGDSELLSRVWRILRASTYQPDHRMEAPAATFYTHWRVGGRFEGSPIHAVIWMSFSSTVCKLVQTGTRTVEQPIYEVECASALAELGV